MSVRIFMQRFAYWLPVFGYGGFLYYLAAHDRPELPPWFPGGETVVRGACYFGLGFLTLRALACSSGMITRHSLLLAILLASAYGVTDEWHRLAGLRMLGRTADPWVLFAAIVGATLGSFGYLMLNDWMLRRLLCNSPSKKNLPGSTPRHSSPRQQR